MRLCNNQLKKVNEIIYFIREFVIKFERLKTNVEKLKKEN